MPQVTNMLPPMDTPVSTILEKRSSVVIASIWPRPFRKEEMHCQMSADEAGNVSIRGCTVYEIPAAPESDKESAHGVQYLRVYDSFVRLQSPQTIGDQPPEVITRPLWAKDIAESLVRSWTGEPGGAKLGGTMGVMVIAGETATMEEINQMLTSQRNYCQLRYNEAQQNYLQGHVNRIGDVERLAARWMNNHTKTPWYGVTNIGEMKTCLGCGDSLPAAATVCKTCGDLVKLSLQGRWPETQLKEEDPVTYEAMKAMRARINDRKRKRKEREAVAAS